MKKRVVLLTAISTLVISGLLFGQGYGPPSSSGAGTSAVLSWVNIMSGNVSGNLTVTPAGKIGSAQLLGGAKVTALTAPATPTCTKVGTGAGTDYRYTVTALSASGATTAPAACAAVNHQAWPLNATHYVTVKVTAVPGAAQYNFYRTVGGATQGIIATTTATQIKDTGLAGDGTTAPLVNSSGKGWFTGLDIGSAKITNVADGVAASDAATVGQISAGPIVSVSTIDINSGAAQALYPVPTGKTFHPLYVVLRDPTASAALIVGSLGLMNACTNFTAFDTQTGLTGAGKQSLILASGVGATSSIAAGAVFGIILTVPAGVAGTMTVDLFGYLTIDAT